MRRDPDGGPTWTLNDHLLAGAVDALRGANWQRGGAKGSKPKPIPRPGTSTQARHGYTDRTPADVANYFARFRPAEAPTN